MRPTCDDRDRALFLARVTRRDLRPGPRVGDYVDFADGVTRRMSHVWTWEPRTVQTSDGGSFYLADGACSFSGSLFPGIPTDTLTLTPEERPGETWLFHHNHASAHNGVTLAIPCRVYTSTLAAPR